MIAAAKLCAEIEDKDAAKELATLIVNHSNCTDAVVRELVPSRFYYVRELVAKSPQASAETLSLLVESCINLDDNNYAFLIAQKVVINPNCNAEILGLFANSKHDNVVKLGRDALEQLANEESATTDAENTEENSTADEPINDNTQNDEPKDEEEDKEDKEEKDDNSKSNTGSQIDPALSDYLYQQLKSSSSSDWLYVAKCEQATEDHLRQAAQRCAGMRLYYSSDHQDAREIAQAISDNANTTKASLAPLANSKDSGVAQIGHDAMERLTK